MTRRGRPAALAGMCVALLLTSGCQARNYDWGPIDTGLKPPLSVVSRTTVPQSPFERAPLVAVVRVAERWEVEMRDTGVKSLDPPQFWLAAHAELVAVVRVNERQPTDPDLSRGRLVVRQIRSVQESVRFEFGRLYVLLLQPISKDVIYPPLRLDDDTYEFAVPQGGFEVVNNKLQPLMSGGDLDPYTGRDANQVLAELRSK